jgi:site-specific recombinase XerD
MKTTLRFYIRPEYKNQNNRVPVYADLRIDTKRERFSINMFVQINAWDPIRQEVRKSDPFSIHFNKKIHAYTNRFFNIENQCLIEGKRITVFEFRQKLLNESEESPSLIEFMEKHIIQVTGILAYDTIRSYKSQLNRLKEFRKDLSFDSVDYQFLKEYEAWLIKTRGYKINSIAKAMRVLKLIMSEATKQKLFRKEDPFKTYKIKQVDGDRESLTIDELQTLMNIFYSEKLKEGHQNVLRAFLFECNTGLRYSDLKSLKMKHIKKTETGQFYIAKHQNKTDNRVFIPLTSFATSQLPTNAFENQNVLKVYTNQYYNRELKKVISDAGINKVITTHCARHTFAMISLENDTSLQMTSSMLGHTKITTTQVYSKPTLKNKIKEIQKWNK